MAACAVTFLRSPTVRHVVQQVLIYESVPHPEVRPQFRVRDDVESGKDSIGNRHVVRADVSATVFGLESSSESLPNLVNGRLRFLLRELLSRSQHEPRSFGNPIPVKCEGRYGQNDSNCRCDCQPSSHGGFRHRWILDCAIHFGHQALTTGHCLTPAQIPSTASTRALWLLRPCGFRRARGG